jgi:cob(I)alamin adenosyltransferase
MMNDKRDEPVRLTRIYTGGGDSGETSLGDGARVSKDDARIEAFGTVDELNAVIGLALAAGGPTEITAPLERIQNELFDLGADLAVPVSSDDEKSRLRVTSEQASTLEGECDSLNEALEPLKSFVLPGGSELAARLHHARTVCRRAERRIVTLAAVAEVTPAVIVYVNRLSDLLFIMARAASHEGGSPETLWRPGASR